MQKYLLTTLAMLTSAWAYGSEPAPLDACASPQFSQTPEPTKNGGDGLSVFKKVCYADASGSYVLYLLANKGDVAHEPHLSRAIQIQLFKLSNGAHLQSMARDASTADEAGVAFLPELIEVRDIDGDGLIDPIIVYRFYTLDRERQGRDDLSGRIKIITFYKGQKVAIRAITGEMDGARSTTASANSFKLPKAAQIHLVKKMKRMYDNGQFGFNNSFGFNPRREGE